MSSITLSAGVRQSLSALQSAAAQSSVIQNRLATGKKVNSALDNPSAFFTASGLSSRANDLSRLMDDMGQAVKTLQAADKGLSAITKLVENAQSIAKQAKAFRIDSSSVTGAAATKLTAGATLDTYDLANADEIEVVVTNADGTDVTITHTIAAAATETVQDIINTINADADTDITAKLSGGQLEIADAKGREIAVTITAADAGADDKLWGTASLTAEASVDKRITLQEDFDSLMVQIDQLARDSSYNGVNLLDGDKLTVEFNETGKSKLDISGASINAAGLEINTLTLDTEANIDTALNSLKTATDELRSQSATFGANLSVVQNRQDFTKGMIDTLTSGADALVIADPNEEGASLLALNTRSQIAQTTLAMASQADSAVLRLF
jgi:flagellin-like hook-associated protein FlgL